MKKGSSLQGILGSVLVFSGIGLALFWPQIKDHVQSWVFTDQVDHLLLANFKAETSGVFVKPFKNNQWEEIKSGGAGSLGALDQIQTGSRSSALLIFASNYQLRLNENSRAMLELIVAGTEYQIVMHLMAGSYEVIRKGATGQLFIQANRKRFFPEDQVAKRDRWDEQFFPLMKLSQQGQNLSQQDPATIDTEAEDKSLDRGSSPGVPSEELTGDKLLPLSNFEMDQELARSQNQFKKCQLNAIRDQEVSTGELLFGITVKPNGRVSEVKILSTDIPDGAFLQCLKSVIERIQFRQFPPPEVVRSYPIIFE